MIPVWHNLSSFYIQAVTGIDPRKGWRTPLNIIKYSEQRDEETGLSYFGARYYDADRTTGWLSEDPMMDKYPSMSPYNYCAGNPVKLVDPDGNDVWDVSDDGHIKKTSEEGGFKRQTLIYSNGQVVKYKGAMYHQVMYDLSNEGDNSISASYGNSNMQSVYATVFKSMADNTNVEWRMDRYTDGHYSLGTLHNQRKSPSSYDLSNGRQNDNTTVTLIHSHPMASGYPNPETVESQKSSMGYWGQKGLAGDAYKKRYTSLKNTYYYTYFPKTNQLWSVGTFRPAFIRNIRSAADFFFGTFNTR